MEAQVLKWSSPLLVWSKASSRAAASEQNGARCVRTQPRVANGEARDDLVSTALEWPQDFEFTGLVPEGANLLHFRV